MKLSIYDFFEGFEDTTREPSAERIRELTMKKIESPEKIRKPARKISLAAAVIAAVLLLSVGVYAAWGWTGYLSTGDMSEWEIRELMEKVQYSGKSVSEDADGNVHYFDSEGREYMVLTREEARQFERAMEEAREKENQENAGDLIDTSKLVQQPRSITRMQTDEKGDFEDFLLGNGSMVILHDESANGYELSAGDMVTICVDASAACIVEFGMFRDGEMIESETVKMQDFEQTFAVPEDGTYCFTLMYYSADCDHFTECNLNIQAAE